MSFSMNIRMKIVLLMVTFESSTIVQLKLETEFGKNAPKKDCITATLQCFCEIGTIENREHSGTPSRITEERTNEANDVTENQQ